MVTVPDQPERIEALSVADACALAARWLISEDLARRMIRAAQVMWFNTRMPVSIISGFRSAAQQRQLEDAGRPAAPEGLSTHRTCPATGADIRILAWSPNDVRASWMLFATNEGLRVGGGGPIDEGTLLPVDWNHVDLGPRLQG